MTGPVRCTAGLAAGLLLLGTGRALAFPFLDATNADQVPQGTELATPDAQDLQHQLQIVNGLGAPAGGGWTFVPRIDAQEELTDNVFAAHSPRVFDAVSYFAPGFSLVGDLPRVQMSFDFAPTLSLYARDGDLNSLTDQMNGIASVTLVPDLFYVDLRALAGVHSLYGGLGGIGTVGATTTAPGGIPTLAGNTVGLNKDNEVQTTSFAVSPYLLRRFGDIGTAKVGYSAAVTESDTLNGFASSPFPTGGANAQTLVSNEEIATFTTGDVVQFFQDIVSVDLLQSQTTTGANGAVLFDGAPAPPGVFTSNRVLATNRVSYVLNRDLTVFATGGYEDISYSSQSAQSITGVFETFGPNGQMLSRSYTYANNGVRPIRDAVWNLGATWTPDPYSSITVSYGHQNGVNSLTANGHYDVTARSVLTASYGTTLGTQLENIQNQQGLQAPNANRSDAQTGGTLFGPTNALGVEDGVFRTTTLTVGSTTSLDRDIISVNLLMAKQTSAGIGPSSSAQTETVSANWLHQMRPDMTVSAALSYSLTDQTTGIISAANPGNNTSIVASLAWQWQISDTLSTSLRYSYLERSSPITVYDIYQNIIILGVSKRF